MNNKSLTLREIAFRECDQKPENCITSGDVFQALNLLIEAVNDGELKAWYKDRVLSFPDFVASVDNAHEIYVYPDDYERYRQNVVIPRIRKSLESLLDAPNNDAIEKIMKTIAENEATLPGLFPEKSSKGIDQRQENSSSLLCPPGTKWEDISFKLVSDDMVEIETPQGKSRYTYHKLEMEDKRKGDVPKTIWALLKLFIKSHGVISSNVRYDPKLPDTAKRLNKHLKKLFGISHSIYANHYKVAKEYRVRFQTYLSPDYNHPPE